MKAKLFDFQQLMTYNGELTLTFLQGFIYLNTIHEFKF